MDPRNTNRALIMGELFFQNLFFFRVFLVRASFVTLPDFPVFWFPNVFVKFNAPDICSNDIRTILYLD